MPSLSGANTATWRTGKPYSVQGHVFILKPTVIFQARINMASVTYPLTALTFDTVTTGAYTDIEAGMTLLLGSSAGASDLGRQRVRAAATTTSIPIGRTSKGTHWGELNVSDNMYITVLDLREVWAKIPFINSSGVSLKDQTSFAANIAQPPVANGGCAVADFVDSVTDELEVDFDGTNSFYVDPAAVSLTYSWDFVDGTPSSSTSSTVSGVAFPAGFRYVGLTVSDGTRSHTTRIPVYAAERSGINAPIPVEVSTRTLKPEGQQFSFTLRAQDLDVDDYPNGTLVIYFEEERYGRVAPASLAGPTGRENVKFVGWLDTEQTNIEAGQDGIANSVTLTALDVAARLRKLPGFGQIVNRKTSPTTWQQMKSADVNRYMHHLLHWHSTALEVAPFSWSNGGSAYEFVSLSSDAQNLYSQVDQIAQAIAYKLVCSQRGELGIKADPQRLDVINRTTTVIVDLVATDWSSTQMDESPAPVVHWLNESAVRAHALQIKSYFSRAPGPTPGQGENGREIGSQLVLDQHELNVRCGHDYRRANQPQGILEVQLAHGGDAGIEPALMEWVTFQLEADEAAQRGVTIATGTRFLVLETTIEIDQRAGTHDVRLRLEREVRGFEGQTVVQKTQSQITPAIPNYPLGPAFPGFPADPAIFQPNFPLVIGDPTLPLEVPRNGNAVMVYDISNIYITQGFRRSDSPDWNVATPDDIEGSIIHAMLDPFGYGGYILAGTQADWCYEFDFASGAQSWQGSTNGSGQSYATFSSNGFVTGTASIEGIIIRRAFGTPATVTAFEITLDSALPGSASNRGSLYRTDNASPISSVTRQNNGTGPVFTVSIPATLCSGFTLGVDTDHVGSGGITNTRKIIKVKLMGTGANPFGANNCGGSTGEYSVWYTPNIWNESPVWTQGAVLSATNAYRLLRPTQALNELYAYSSAVAATRFSDDNGLTWATAETVGTAAAAGGMDTSKVGSQVLASASGQTYKASDGGSYSSYGGAKGQGAIFIPRWIFGSTSSGNTGANPEYLLAAAALDSSESMWKVTASGATFTAITPVVSTHKGLAISPNCIVMPYRSGARIAAILSFNSTRRLVTSTNSGSSWTDRGALTSSADNPRMRKSDTLLKELYFVDEVPKFSNDFGATISSKDSPSTAALIGIEVYG